MIRFLLLITSFLALSIVGCDSGPKSGRGFTLPDGDIAKGEATFVQLECTTCHAIAGKPEIAQPESADISVVLGGKTRRIQTYGELVTSVINPSHKLAKGYPQEEIADTDGESKMSNYNEIMSVEQLINLVAFLQEQYELEPYDPTKYHVYLP